LSEPLRRRALLRGFAASTCLFLPAQLRAADSLSELVARVGKAREGLRTLRGPFTQTRTIGLLATDVVSHGVVTLVRPDRLRWELDPPDAVVFWIGPEGIAYRSSYGAGALPAVTGKAADALSDLRALLGDDLRTLQVRWQLRVERDDPDGCRIEATERTPPSGFARRIELALAPDLLRPTFVRLEDGPRDRTSIQFSEMQLNASVDPRTMKP
jgi:hypothetical protein